MKKISISIFILFLAVLMVGGCSKDEDVAELEQQIKDTESEDLLKDTLAGEKVVTGETEMTEEKYSMTPEAAPEEEKTPSYMPEYTGTGQYTVQVAAGGNPEWVKYMAETFIRRGYEAFITEAIVDGETFYRLRIGSYDSFSKAKAAGMELADKYSVDYWIDYNQ
ncbi:MAG: hypothetical protein DRP46_05860 [Candidatus Zixiibacteriota bacterium]|nr:MAG: hypothetical protein DRP46_05860 [candidate division Zixibacteria bacterium]